MPLPRSVSVCSRDANKPNGTPTTMSTCTQSYVGSRGGLLLDADNFAEALLVRCTNTVYINYPFIAICSWSACGGTPQHAAAHISLLQQTVCQTNFVSWVFPRLLPPPLLPGIYMPCGRVTIPSSLCPPSCYQ